MKNLGKLDWRTLQRYTSPQAVKDFDAFLDSLPVNAGYNALIAAGIAWIIAGAAVVFTSMQVDRVSTLRTELMKVEALQPPIPQLLYIPVPKDQLDTLGKKIVATYPGVAVTAESDGKAKVSATDTDYFPQFMAAVSTLQNGGANWRVLMDDFCVGRDCTGQSLSTTLKIEIARIGEPAAIPEIGAATEGGAPPMQ